MRRTTRRAHRSTGRTVVSSSTSVRVEFAARLHAVLADVDAIACPSGGAPALPITKETQYGSMTAHNAFVTAFPATSNPPRQTGMVFTVPANVAGTPAICLPSGYSPAGLPYSIQFVGRRLSEPVLCRIAHAYEQATSWHARHPNVDTV